MAGYQDLLQALAKMNSGGGAYNANGSFQVPYQIPGTISSQQQQPFSSSDVVSVYNDEANAKRKLDLAQALMSGNGHQVHGPIGALSQVLGVIAGAKMEKGANEKYSDALARKFELENKAAIAKINAEADAKVRGAGAEESAKLNAQTQARLAAGQQLGLKGDALTEYVTNGKTEKTKLEMKDGIVFNPETGQSTIDPKAQQAIVAQKQAERAPSELQQKIGFLRSNGVPEDQIKAMVLGSAGAAGNTDKPPGDANLTGQDYLGTLTPSMAAQVKAISEGRAQLPTGYAMRSPQAIALRNAVAQFDPQFDFANAGARAKTRADFTSGKSAQNIRALNTAVGHLGALNDQIEGTASHAMPMVNAAENAVSTAFGGAGVPKFNQTATALASELTTVFRGSGGAEADVKRYLEQLDPNASAAQKKAAVQNITQLLHSRLNALGEQYSQGMGKTQDPFQLLTPEAAKRLAQLGVTGSGATDQASGQPADPLGIR
jgi:hypothetical protein